MMWGPMRQTWLVLYQLSDEEINKLCEVFYDSRTNDAERRRDEIDRGLQRDETKSERAATANDR